MAQSFFPAARSATLLRALRRITAGGPAGPLLTED
jgi:hypothetical protein